MSKDTAYIVGAILIGALFIALGLGFVGYQLSSLITVTDYTSTGKRALNVKVNGSIRKPVYIDSGYPGIRVWGDIGVSGTVETYQ